MSKPELISQEDKSLDLALYLLNNNVKLDSSSAEEEIILAPVEEEEETGGAFSKQKGGSAALSLDAYIAAMNAQIEAVMLRRERAQSMIEMDFASTKLASDNVLSMGREQQKGLMGAAIGSIVGGAVSVGGAGFSGISSYRSNNSVKGQHTEVDNYTTALKALDDLDKAKMGQPYAATVVTDAAGGVVPGSRTDALNKTIHEMTTNQTPIKSVANSKTAIDANKTSRNADADLVDSEHLMKLSDEQYNAVKHMTQSERNDFRKHLSDKKDYADGVIRHAQQGQTNQTQIVQMLTGAVDGFAKGAGSIVQAQAEAARAELEAEKMQFELSGRYASQEVSANNENAGQRESEIYATIRTLQSLTAADIRG